MDRLQLFSTLRSRKEKEEREEGDSDNESNNNNNNNRIDKSQATKKKEKKGKEKEKEKEKETPKERQKDVNESFGDDDNENGPIDKDLMTAAVSEIREEKKVVEQFWGTNILVEDVKKRFIHFIENFQTTSDKRRPLINDDNGNDNMDQEEDGDQQQQQQKKRNLYMEHLQVIFNQRKSYLNVNLRHVFDFDRALYHQWIRYPTEMIPLLDYEINIYFEKLYPPESELDIRPIIEIRPFNLKTITPMRNLNPSDIDQIISIRGLIIRCSSVIPDLKMAFFQCAICEFSVEVEIKKGKITEPSQCDNCKARLSMALIHNRCAFSDKQYIKLQETPDAIPEGETPHTVALFAYDNLIDFAKPGDRVEITGVFKASPMRAGRTTRTLRSIYKTYIDTLHIKRTEKGRLGASDSSAEQEQQYEQQATEEGEVGEEEQDILEISKEHERELIELSKRPDIYDLITKSLAPSIWEMDDVKKGILCQLFGGANKKFSESSGGGRFRGDINILMCGDPGTSKSQLLSFVHKIAPRGIYTSGKGSSAVGLTAYVTRDPDTRETVLESGALVLSDMGICCIDEFDKMSDETRSILHEVMEQQTVSVAKAGIICTLNARTSILASANPKESRYNPKMSVVENIKLPPTLLSRFDLIYLILDKANERTDRLLAKHLVSLYWEKPDVPFATLPKHTLTNYISYARKHVNPEISDDSVSRLVNGYLRMRNLGGGGKRTISATPRQLESLIRISEAHARIRFSKVVEPLDVEEAIRLVNVALQQAAIDPTTGTIDMDLITTGKSASHRDAVKRMESLISEVISSSDTGISFENIMNELNKKQQIQQQQSDVVREALRQMEVDVEFSNGLYKFKS